MKTGMAGWRNSKWLLFGDFRGEGEPEDVSHHCRSESQQTSLSRFDVEVEIIP